MRRELAGADIDTTVSPPPSSSEAANPAKTATPSLSTRASSAEYVVTGIKQHRVAVAGVIAVLLITGIAIGAYFYRRTNLFAASGKKDQALKILRRLDEISRQRYVPAYSFAIVYAELNEKDQAFQWLEKCYLERCIHLLSIKFDPLIKNLRSDSRFAEIARRVGYQAVTW